MVVIRLVAILFVIASFILLGLYLYSKDSKYLLRFKQLASAAGWFLLIVMLLMLISRILRL